MTYTGLLIDEEIGIMSENGPEAVTLEIGRDDLGGALCTVIVWKIVLVRTS